MIYPIKTTVSIVLIGALFLVIQQRSKDIKSLDAQISSNELLIEEYVTKIKVAANHKYNRSLKDLYLDEIQLIQEQQNAN